MVGREQDLAEIGWDGGSVEKLWRYNQHYFDDLTASGADARTDWHRALIGEWIASNPPGVGTGWEPYPTSLRIVNWIKWALAGNQLSNETLSSLATQARWLERRLEWHLLGNHLFANAKALLFAGLFFGGPEAEAWSKAGERIVDCQIPEQILPDGGQFELSPMYHAIALEDLLDLMNLARACGKSDLAARCSARIPAMLDWLAAMSHPDGGIAFFNDAAFSIAPDLRSLAQYAERLGMAWKPAVPRLVHLADSGYARLAAGDFMLIADLGPVGPDYLPGHGHADTLSFELSFANQRIFVNSGTSEYGMGPERQRQRETAAHNTVTVAGENSSEVWAGFRVGRRARPVRARVEEVDGRLQAEGGHDGYRYLPGAPLVHRSFHLEAERLTVTDSISPPCPGEARFHIHPEVTLTEPTAHGAVLLLPHDRFLRLEFAGGTPRLERATWHPQFGASVPNLCLVLPLREGRAQLTIAAP